MQMDAQEDQILSDNHKSSQNLPPRARPTTSIPCISSMPLICPSMIITECSVKRRGGKIKTMQKNDCRLKFVQSNLKYFYYFFFPALKSQSKMAEEFRMLT